MTFVIFAEPNTLQSSNWCWAAAGFPKNNKYIHQDHGENPSAIPIVSAFLSSLSKERRTP